MLKLALLGALALAPVAARAQVVVNKPVVLTNTPQLIVGANGSAGWRWSKHYRVCNADAVNSGWLTRASNTPAPYTAGSYAILPGKCEEFDAGMGGYVPNGADTYGVSDASGHTTQLTVEVF